MEQTVMATLASGEGDMEYWEAVLKRLKLQKVGVGLGLCLPACLDHARRMHALGRHAAMVQGCGMVWLYKVCRLQRLL